MLKQYKLRFYNFRLVIFLLAISVIGIVLVGSAREDLKSKQLVGVILGLIIMVILSLMDYSWISNFQWIMYGANIVLLLIVRLFGDSANGAARWIDFGFIRFQPTELSKIIIILFFARFFMDHEEDLNTFKTLAKSVILLAIPLFLIYEQPDMKNTLMLLAVFCILIYIAGLSYKIIGGMFLIIIPLAIIFVSIVVQPDQKLIKDYQRKRIMAFLYPENEEYSDDIEQQNNSKTAIASGELIGKKLSGDKEVASVNDGNFVSENQTDFIFAVAGEEYGFMGCCSFCGMYPDEPAGKRLVRKDHMLWYGKYHIVAELPEYMRGYGNRAKYRYTASICQLWTYVTDQSLYRNGYGIECRTSEQRIQ